MWDCHGSGEPRNDCESLSPSIPIVSTELMKNRSPKMGLLFIQMVETIGIEPMTPCTSSRYSNQLS